MLIYLKDRPPIELPEGSTAKDLADKLNLNGPHEALGASVNGKTVCRKRSYLKKAILLQHLIPK